MRYEQALTAAAAKCGVSLADLKVLSVSVDRTWGDLVGYAFIGPEPIVERAVKHCLSFHSYLRRPGTYGCQNATMDRGVRTVYVDVKTLREAGLPTRNECGQEALKARVVSTEYYPCAE